MLPRPQLYTRHEATRSFPAGQASSTQLPPQSSIVLSNVPSAGQGRAWLGSTVPQELQVHSMSRDGGAARSSVVSSTLWRAWKLLGVEEGWQRDCRKRKMQCRGGTADDDDEDAWGYVTYCVERALPVVGDVGLAFRRFLEDPFVTFIRGHLSHQPACGSDGPNQTDPWVCLLAHYRP